VDEVAYAKGHKNLTLVYQSDSDCRHLVYVSQGRSVKAFLRFFRVLSKSKIDYASTIRFACSDIWKASLKVIAKKLPTALHILDRYHIVAKLCKALDKVRTEEAPALSKQGWDVRKRSRCLRFRRRKRLYPILPTIFSAFALSRSA
jgi:transposase